MRSAVLIALVFHTQNKQTNKPKNSYKGVPHPTLRIISTPARLIRMPAQLYIMVDAVTGPVLTETCLIDRETCPLDTDGMPC